MILQKSLLIHNTLMSVDNMTLEQLQKIEYEINSPFLLNFNEYVIQCNNMIRVVPGKRLVFMGTLSANNSSGHKRSDEKVIIKMFVHSSRAKKHWFRERTGAELLKNNHILTPELLLHGLSDEGIYFLIFKYIKGQNLAQFWVNNDQDEQEKKLKDLLPVLENHHRFGLAHQDLHYANFLLSDTCEDSSSTVYTLDGEEVKTGSIPLEKKARLQNLALFFAQTFDLSKKSSLSLLNDYVALTSLSINAQEANQFWQIIMKYRQERIEQYLKKILRECTEVIYSKKKNSYTLCRREYHNSAIQQLLDQPEHFFQSENSVYLKQGNTCTVKSVLVDNEKYVVKRYNPKGIKYELMHKGQISRARKSWMNSHLLRFMGILTPNPVALIEQNPALGQRCSYFICQYQEGQSSWDFFCEKECEENLDKDKKTSADELIATLKKLSEYKITHGDLKGSNFLINNNKVWLIDLDAMTQHKKNWRFEKNWQRDKTRFLKNWDKKVCYDSWKLYFQQAFEQTLF
ncbi:MAG: hypothetical protein OQL19_04355 [Gammaproteobacteria bacterium]|nr:hypothetical protein [Gammaproteobacteria bacterium]